MDKDRFCQQLELPESVHKLSSSLAQTVLEKTTLTKRNPRTVCAAVMYVFLVVNCMFISCRYISCLLEDVRRTQADICRITGLTEVTLRKVYKELGPQLKQLLPPGYTSRVPVECVSSRSNSSYSSQQTAPIIVRAARHQPIMPSAIQSQTNFITAPPPQPAQQLLSPQQQQQKQQQLAQIQPLPVSQQKQDQRSQLPTITTSHSSSGSMPPAVPPTVAVQRV